MTLTSPNGGETIPTGSTFPIRWTALGITLVKLEYSSNKGGSWTTIVASMPASAGSYDWAVPLTTTTEGIVRVSDASNPSVSDASDSPFAIVSAVVVRVGAGWNMISLPVTVTDSRVSSLFPTATSSAFAYETGYVVADLLENGVGYWLKFSKDQDVFFAGTSIDADTLELRSGWNLIGSVSGAVPAMSVVQNPPDIVSSRYFGYNGTYHVADTLWPGKSYWVKLKTDGLLIMQR